MTVQVVTEQLRQWIIEQARAGCPVEVILAGMRASGWRDEVAVEAVERTLRDHLDAQRADAPPAVAVPEPDLDGSPGVLRADDREVRLIASLRSPRVLVLGGLLDDDECEALIASARPRLARSETVAYATGGTQVHDARTSRGMFFARGETELCERIERRIATLVNWPVENGEGLQVLHYRTGAEYRPHYDWFDPAQPGTAAVLARGGQRVATLVMYLNTPARGGATVFPDIGLEVAAIRGNAVFFSYERAHASSRTLHGGATVIAGDKWVATKWLREREFV